MKTRPEQILEKEGLKNKEGVTGDQVQVRRDWPRKQVVKVSESRIGEKEDK